MVQKREGNRSCNSSAMGMYEGELAKKNALLQTQNIQLMNTIKKLANGEKTQNIESLLGTQSTEKMRRDNSLIGAKGRSKSTIGVEEGFNNEGKASLRPMIDLDDGEFRNLSNTGNKNAWDDKRTASMIRQMVSTVMSLQKELAKKVGSYLSSANRI